MSIQRNHPDAEIIIETELPPLPAEGKARLRTLIAFLKELPPEKFDFSTVVAEQDNDCGTVCCAIGWCPVLFPDLAKWGYHDTYSVHAVFTKNSGGWFDSAAKDLFGMSEEIARSIFAPNYQKKAHESLPRCGPYAGPMEVAAMLESYITLTETPKGAA